MERADTETAPVCFLLSFFGWFCFFFSFTETALCINDCEEINLLSKEIYGASSYWADRLGSPWPWQHLSGLCLYWTRCLCSLLPCWALGQPGTTWFALNYHLLPLRCIVLVPSELAVLSVSVACRRCPLSSFSQGFISLVLCVGCQGQAHFQHTHVPLARCRLH